MQKKTKMILAVILFILLLLFCYVGYNYLSKNYGRTQEKPSQQTETKVKKTKAPDFTVYDLNGKTVRLSDYKGKPIVVNFWASWCPPCKGELPHFESAYQKRGSDVVFLMVDLTDGERETQVKAQGYLKSMNYTFPVYFDLEENAVSTYGISSIPMTLFVNKNGEIADAYKGSISEDTLSAGIEAIIK